ncbi:putative sister chromatid cohesion protein dcc1 [Golovinomyces cichoracearum]|uniref:Putative sister chromatid cohesion protein dcc1 n=1 Tax=Golovinomyces cichoracearum TaxID=62708 RepID=A0A420I7H2_9PEZI|nr:putative sister chromatid cohesion protein dcc1 [Golovinomyces cichoracearum]
MLTQQSNNIGLLIKHEKEPYKLIELPPDLLELLESTSSPNLSITPGPSSTAPEPAVLKLGPQAYSMRSKNSSNTILLLQPPARDLNANENSTVDTLIAVSQCNETIELVPISNSPGEEVKKKNKWHEKFVKSR